MKEVESRAKVHAALGDPVRLRIVDELLLSDRSPIELAERFSIRSNLLAHHLAVLEEAGLIDRVVSHGDRRRRYVRLVPDGVAGLLSPAQLRTSGIVFVCTRNSARSQLAAALWNGRSQIPATSAGTEPAERVHPGAVRAGRRRGLDLSGAIPTALRPDEIDGRLVVTVCDMAHEDVTGLGEASGSGLPLLHWSIEDPAESGRAADFDSAADAIDARIRALLPAVLPD